MPIRLAQYRNESMAKVTTCVLVKSSVLPQPVVSSSRPVLDFDGDSSQIVEAAPADRRAFDAAFACVVVDHVHDDFEAGLVQCAHHVYDFLAHGGRALLLGGFSGVGGFGGEVAEGGVAPVVLAAVFLQEELVLLAIIGSSSMDVMPRPCR
mgnify:CR=1 FL=1